MSTSRRLAERLVVYTVLHQPRRLRLPAQPVPLGTPAEELSEHLFDEPMNRRYFEKVAESCYVPATAMFKRLTAAGWKMAIGFSNSFLLQAEAWGPSLLGGLRRLCASGNVEVVCVEPYPSWLCYPDIQSSRERLPWARTRTQSV